MLYKLYNKYDVIIGLVNCDSYSLIDICEKILWEEYTADEIYSIDVFTDSPNGRCPSYVSTHFVTWEYNDLGQLVACMNDFPTVFPSQYNQKKSLHSKITLV
jgi:hypothetical protein